MPKTSSANKAIHAAQKLSQALQNPHPAAPFTTVGQPRLEAIKQLANIYTTLTSKTITQRKPPRVILPTPLRVGQTRDSHRNNEPHLILPKGPHRAYPPIHDTKPAGIWPGRAEQNAIPLVPSPIPNDAPHGYNTRLVTDIKDFYLNTKMEPTNI
jgi:hypothetical protein